MTGIKFSFGCRKDVEFSAGKPASLPIKRKKKRVEGECHRFNEKQHVHVHNLIGVYTVGF